MTNLNVTNKKVLIDDFKAFISNNNNFKEEPKKKNNFSNVVINPKLYLYCDIETFRYNISQSATAGASAVKNATWIVQVAYFENDNKLPNWAYFSDFKEFLNIMATNSCEGLAHYDIILVFHNGFKYDNHFLQKELQSSLQLQLYNNINEKSTNYKYKYILDNENIKKLPSNYKERDSDYLAVSAIRSSTSHALKFSYKGLFFETQDSYLKTNEPLVLVGQKCLEKGLLEKEYIKDKEDIDFSVDKYNLYNDLSDNEVEVYKAYLLTNLQKSEMKYVRNDVVVVAMCHKHFSDLYYGFSWDEFTFSGNVKKAYEKNGYYKDLTNFQLTKKTPKGKMKFNKNSKHKTKSNLTLDDKPLAGWKSAEKFFRQFYRGGLNMYNENYVGTIITPKKAGFSMDLNSSYPTVMYNEKLPTYLVDASHFDKIKRIPKDLTYFYMFTVTPKSMDNLLKYVPSRVIRQMFVKYYPVRNDGFIYINSVALSTLEKFMTKRIENLRFIHCYKWKCEHFGARNVIKDNYFIKQQGKSKYEFEKPFNPLDIKVTNKINNDLKTPDEVQASKVLLNGIYGIPAMRPTFPQFVYQDDGKAISMPDGHKNQERNVVFSVGVTAFAFRNLITPLMFLTPEEIDSYFWYCDTDSLYLDGAVRDKIVKEHGKLFDKNNLGCWDLEHTNIIKFYPFNHKKYALFDTDDKNPLTVHAGGVTKENVKQWITDCTNTYNDSKALDLLVDKYFHNGTKIKVTRSILTNFGTVDIYEGESVLQDGVHNGTKVKHYLNSYKEAREQKDKVINYISDNYDELMAQYNEALSNPEVSDLDSILAEVNINGYREILSYDGIVATKDFITGENKPIFIDKVSKKEQNTLIKQLEEYDNSLIHTYKNYRTFIDWQNERLEVLNQNKLFNNLKFYFSNKYLAREISEGVYLTVDFRVIRKENLKEYKIDLANFTSRFNNKKYFVFTEYVRLFLNFTLNDKVKTIENFLDKLIYDNYSIENVKDIALYRDMYIKIKDKSFRDPENDLYSSKEYIGYRLKDLKSIYFNNMEDKLRKKVCDYVSQVQRRYDKDK